MAEEGELNNVDRLSTVSKTIFKTAKAAAAQSRKLKGAGFEKTANALCMDVFPPELNPDDPNRLTAIQAIYHLETGTAQNIVNLLADVQTKKEYDMQTITDTVENTNKLLAASPDDQLQAIKNAVEGNIDYLMIHHKDQIHETLAQAATHPLDYPPDIQRILERQIRLLEASAELTASSPLQSEASPSPK